MTFHFFHCLIFYRMGKTVPERQEFQSSRNTKEISKGREIGR